MPTPDVADLMARLQEVEEEQTRLEEEVTRLRAANLEVQGWRRSQAAGEGDAAPGRMSRSQFLRMGGAAAAGAVAAGASGLLSARPAGAATGNPLLLGQANAPTAPTDVTVIQDPSTTQLSPTLLRASNSTTTDVTLPAARIAAAGTTSGTDDTTQPKVGLWGQTDDANNGGAGVIGRGGTSGLSPFNIFGFKPSSGVIGTAPDGNFGVLGACNGASGFGVCGVSVVGTGVVGIAASGIDLAAEGGGRLRQILRATPGPPTTGVFVAGEQIRDSNGQLWLCVADGFPGTWRRAAIVKDGFNGGSVNMLAKPIRIFDSRPGAPLAPGASVDVQITGVVVGGVSVPAGAVALLGNIAVTQTQGPKGYLTVFPEGSPPSPATANINWFGPNQDLNTSVVAALNPANGKLTIQNGVAAGSAPTHVVLDAAAFVI